MTYLKKAVAFTLAETLVVMGIIGVVAALTIPNLNQSTGDREKVAKVKKIYANLEDAFGRATAVYGPIEEWFKNDGDDYKAQAKRFGERMTEFMKVSKNCELGEGCFSNQNLLLPDGTANYHNYLEELIGNSYMVTLADGTSLAFQIDDSGYSDIKIRIDIDGPNKGKNQAGNDIFDAFIVDGQLKSMVYEDNEGLDVTSSSNFTYWVLQNGNLDYLKCPEELDWDTKTSCK